MPGTSTLTIINHVNDLALAITSTGGLDSSALNILTTAVSAESQADVLKVNRDAGVKNGQEFHVLTTFGLGSLSMVVDIKLVGTLTDSNMWVGGTIGGVATAILSDTGITTADGTLNTGNGSLEYALTVNRVSSFLGHDDIVVTVAPVGQDPGRNQVLMPWQKAEFFPLLDVWGEGRIVTTDNPPVISGFRQAYNVNKSDQRISNGPNRGQPIPNQIPVANYNGTNFGWSGDGDPMVVPDKSVMFMTVMGSPIVAPTALEMVRVLDPIKGVVLLYGCDSNSIAAFEGAKPSTLVLKKVANTAADLDPPFNEPRGAFYPVRLYGWSQHTDHVDL